MKASLSRSIVRSRCSITVEPARRSVKLGLRDGWSGSGQSYAAAREVLETIGAIRQRAGREGLPFDAIVPDSIRAVLTAKRSVMPET